jgi:hypothetical protein
MYQPRYCILCQELYNPTGPAAKYCPSCAEDKRAESRERERVKANKGLGKGYWQSLGGKHTNQYKNGIGMYKKIRDQKLLEQGHRCARCSKDLKNLTPHHRCGHHIDHDRTNNDPDNIEVICKSCHQVEHRCWESFKKGATTISKESTPKQVEAPDPSNG